MILGVTGLIGSGKDTIADYLVTYHGFKRISFAASLKDAVAAVFGWDREMLEGRSSSSREWREQTDHWWSERLNKNVTPRWVLQQWGTEVCRKSFDDDIWIASLENKLRTRQDNVVISDCRFPNEIKAIRNQGGKIVWVQRGELPMWYDAALSANQGPNGNPTWALSKAKLERLNIHPSETSWVGQEFDAVIDNNGTLDNLYHQIKNLVQDPRPSREVGIYKPLADSLNISSSD